MGNPFPAVVNSVVGMVFGICHRDQHVKVGGSSIDELLLAALDFLDDPGRRTQMGRGSPHAMNQDLEWVSILRTGDGDDDDIELTNK